ncbi:MAG TPA: transposase [Gemmataceae bacterium]|jgi:putative transposase
MSYYRRNYVAGGTFFFTVVTYERRPILCTEMGRNCLHEALRMEQHRRLFEIVGIVLLPDHLHTIWTLPTNDADFSVRWGQIKEHFTRSFLAIGGEEGQPTGSRLHHRERAVWQRRFWEHTCRDEDDLKRCLDYLHWNPVKHGLVSRVRDYPWSSFHRYARLGEYDPDWGTENPCPQYDEPEWE